MESMKQIIERLINEEKIDWNKVKEAGKSTAKKIHGDADTKIIDSMVAKIKKDGKAKDTQDAIQIIVNMLKSG